MARGGHAVSSRLDKAWSSHEGVQPTDWEMPHDQNGTGGEKTAEDTLLVMISEAKRAGSGAPPWEWGSPCARHRAGPRCKGLDRTAKEWPERRNTMENYWKTDNRLFFKEHRQTYLTVRYVYIVFLPSEECDLLHPGK